MKLNSSSKTPPIYTAEGGKAYKINAEEQLKRLVMSCMLWEGEFYIDGKTIAQNIQECCHKVNPGVLYDIAKEAKDSGLRHVPLLLARQQANHPNRRLNWTAKTINEVIRRPDELAEFLSIYWKDGKCPIAKKVKEGLATAFTKFDEYQLAKWNRDTKIKLRDVLFLCHAKPKDDEQAKVWKRLIDDELATPDTWEVRLSRRDDKKASWEELMLMGKLGMDATLKNLRNMVEAGVPLERIGAYIREKTDATARLPVLPFRYLAAFKAAMDLMDPIEYAMMKGMSANKGMLKGNTAILVDVSGSMTATLSSKSTLTRADAAACLAILAREMGEWVSVYSFSNHIAEVPPYRGFSLGAAIIRSQPNSGTYLASALAVLRTQKNFDRLIVITDEQCTSGETQPWIDKSYMINIGSNKNGVGYGKWTHIDGFSEKSLHFIANLEAGDGQKNRHATGCRAAEDQDTGEND